MQTTSAIIKFFPPHVAASIANYFHESDKQVRLDLHNDKVGTERDYLSRWITLLEYPAALGTNELVPGIRSYFSSNSMPATFEHYLGCDSMFVFRYRNTIKFLLIDAKYPRLQSRYQWDNYINRNFSHFDVRLKRQGRTAPLGALTLAMFITKKTAHTSGSYFDPYGSSFVRREIALHHGHCKTTTRWSQADAKQIINKQYEETGFTGIGGFIGELLNGGMGQEHILEPGASELSFPISSVIGGEGNFGGERPQISEMRIPVDPARINFNRFKSLVQALMYDFGFRHFGFVEYCD